MNKFGFSFNIAIAEINLHVFSKQSIELEASYVPFLTDNSNEAEIEIECFQEIPYIDFETYKLVFEAKNEQQNFYSIYQTIDGLCFVIYDQQTRDDIQQVAYLNSNFNVWKVHSHDALALKYPMGPIIMHYLTVKVDAVMMHASCAFDGKKGRLFSGFSGAGKSTISRIWAESGAQIINDDRLIIRNIGDKLYVYNTPMYYTDRSKKATLDGIYLISHSPINKLNQLSGVQAVSKVMAFCIQNNFDKSIIDRRLEFFISLCGLTPVYELGFVPDENVVKFILENE